jgi:hypothetical protein
MDQKSLRSCSKCGLDESQTRFGDTGRDTHNKTMCRSCINARRKKWRDKNPGWHLYNYLPRTYGISVDDYNSLLVEQNGVCAICERQPTGNSKQEARLHVDHNHETGEVRGLLCKDCNHGIGFFRDNPKLLGKAADYVGPALTS